MVNDPRVGRARRAAGALAMLVAVAGVASCSEAAVGKGTESPTTSSTQQASASPTEQPKPLAVTVTPKNKATDVAPNTQVKISTNGGTISKVSVVSQDGKSKIKGDVGSDGTWLASDLLKPGTTYKVSVTGNGPGGGESATKTSTFSTLTPAVNATYTLPYDGQTVGVGMPVTVQFDSAVTKKEYRKAVEERIDLSVTPEQEGSWGWLDNRQLMWRPKEYFKPGTVVKIKTRFTGLQTGENKWVGKDASGGFKVGDANISYANIKTHQMKVTQNGKTLKTIPFSAGQNRMPYITRSGTKVIIEKQASVIMDSATAGVPKSSPEYYRQKVDLTLRITWTGEYLHSAPWSVASQGRANVSHGCTNLSPSNARWMFDFSKVGDVVIFTGSNRNFEPAEGIGVWQFNWDNWQKQSATV